MRGEDDQRSSDLVKVTRSAENGLKVCLEYSYLVSILRHSVDLELKTPVNRRGM